MTIIHYYIAVEILAMLYFVVRAFRNEYRARLRKIIYERLRNSDQVLPQGLELHEVRFFELTFERERFFAEKRN